MKDQPLSTIRVERAGIKHTLNANQRGFAPLDGGKSWDLLLKGEPTPDDYLATAATVAKKIGATSEASWHALSPGKTPCISA